MSTKTKLQIIKLLKSTIVNAMVGTDYIKPADYTLLVNFINADGSGLQHQLPFPSWGLRQAFKTAISEQVPGFVTGSITDEGDHLVVVGMVNDNYNIVLKNITKNYVIRLMLPHKSTKIAVKFSAWIEAGMTETNKVFTKVVTDTEDILDISDKNVVWASTYNSHEVELTVDI